ncbi:MAG: AEC family transporter [Butyrivibrio sp.]|nr:AEC family transporter [Butyrivibrio sp.]
MSVSVVMQQMGVIAILVAVGVYLYKKQVVDDTVSRRLSTIVMDVCNPALILASILTGNVQASHKELLEAVLLGVVFYVALIALGAIFPILLGVKKDKRRFYNLMVVYTNVGFIGIPVARAILPDKAILYVIVCNIMYSLLFYTHGITVLSNGKEKMSIGKALSPGTIMALLSLVVCWFNIVPPLIITNSVSYIGNATVFLSMTLLGVSIARSGISKGFKDVRIWGYIALRMVLLPIAMFYLLKAIGCDEVTILGFCLMATMPVGNLPLIQSEKIGEETETLSGAITVTTIVSMVTITLLMIFFTTAG